MAEAITNQLGRNRLQACSAGSQPAGQVHPHSLRYLKHARYATEGLRSKSWDEMNDFGPDLVITLCDSAANEACPLWMGDAPKVHWGLTDPSRVEGNEAVIAAAFAAAISQLEARTRALLQLPVEKMDGTQLHFALLELGAR